MNWGPQKQVLIEQEKQLHHLVPDIPTPFEEKKGGSFSAEGSKTSANGARF